MTTGTGVVIVSNMKATPAYASPRPAYSPSAFAELVLWQVPRPGLAEARPTPSSHRLAYVVDEVCVLRYDNEGGKGDHRHYGETGRAYRFTTPDRLIADFQTDIARWNRENSHA